LLNQQNPNTYIFRPEKAEKAKVANSETEKTRNHPNQDQHVQDFR
jgi:hypothetical protein